MSQRETTAYLPLGADDEVGVESARRDEPVVEFFQPRTAARPAHFLCADCLDDRRESRLGEDPAPDATAGTWRDPCRLEKICGAEFVPAGDSGSRMLSLMPARQESRVDVLMCGRCRSNWSPGVTVTARRGSAFPLLPAFRHPGGG
jgi:hypothetical protein